MLLLAIAGCGASPNPTPAATLAETFTFGSGEECPIEPYCLPGLEKSYGLTFKNFVVTDPGGLKTIEALQSDRIQVGILFTTDPHVNADGLVLLEDDRHVQPAENITPILGEDVTAAYGADLADALNAVSATLTTSKLTQLNRQVQIEGETPEAAAASFLQEQRLTDLPDPPRTGPAIIVGSANFTESETLAQIYAQALRSAGFASELRLKIGNRDAYFPMLMNHEIDFIPEYLGSLVGYLGDSNDVSDTENAHSSLANRLQALGLVALNPAPAQNENAIAVSKTTADLHHLTKISDLGQRAP